ncbi:MAG: AI-2E family transporter, partial [Lapillicoccus sp.]
MNSPDAHDPVTATAASGSSASSDRPVATVNLRQPSSGAEARPLWIAITPGSAKRTITQAILLVAALILGSWVFGALSSFIFLLLLSWLLSIAMEPPVAWLVAHGFKRRGLATGTVMVIMLAIIGAMSALFGQVFVAQASQLGVQFPEAVRQALDWVNATFHTEIDVTKIQASLDLTPAKLGDLAGRYGGGILGVFGSVLTFVFDAVTILVFAFYFSADSPRLRQTIGSWLQPRYQKVMTTVWEIAVQKTGGYVISKLLLAGLSALFHSFFFYLIDVPFWLPLGLLAGIVGQFIPTIGTYIGVLLPALFTLLDNAINALWIALFATIYQQIENYVFTPKISKRTMDVHPAIALGSVFVGAALFGPIGAIIGIPVAAAALTIIDTFRRRHELLPELADLQSRRPPQGEEDDPPAEDGPAPEDGAAPEDG